MQASRNSQRLQDGNARSSSADLPGAGHDRLTIERFHLYSESLAESDSANYVGSARVLRGGSWNNNANNCRSACRNNRQPTNSNNNSGFRVAKALDYPLVTFG